MNDVTATIPSHLTDMPQKQERAKNTMGKDDFMKLLMTQLQNQDPLKPMDHHEFASQLAQFGSLEQLQNIQKGIEGLSNGIGDGVKYNALELMGKRVEASGSEVDVISGNPVSLSFTPKEGIQPVKAIVYGDGGKIVREISIDPKARASQIEWDGKDAEGKALSSGKYTFRIQGIDKQGMSTELSSELGGKVTGVDLNGKVPSLVVKTASGEARIELSKVKNVLNDDKGSATPSVAASIQKTLPALQQSIPIEGETPSLEELVSSEGAEGILP